MALKKSELYSSLWSSCDELRGGMDASQYKDYVLVMLFIKYVSDKYADQFFAAITIPEGASFKDMVALKGKSDIGDQINKKIVGPLAKANKLSGMPDFNDPAKLGTDKEMVERLTNLIAIFENPALDFSKNRADGDDILGDAYEYLMRHFATQSGKSKGQFYTPAEVSRTMAQILGIREAETSSRTTIYDPACGSGSLLLKVGEAASAKVTLYGQEKDSTTVGLARMNMILHDNATALVEQGNTLTTPKFTENGLLKTFDYVVANPPFSDKRWSTGLNPHNDPYERFKHFGVPPGKQGDYAYLLHIVRSLKSTGKGACILPHGVLFRGNAEAEIRRNLVRKGYIKGIIGLPANLFYGTGIPACIIVLDKEGAHTRKGIFMIDASAGFLKDRNKNRLREMDIHRIVDVFARQKAVPKYARIKYVRTRMSANVRRVLPKKFTTTPRRSRSHQLIASDIAKAREGEHPSPSAYDEAIITQLARAMIILTVISIPILIDISFSGDSPFAAIRETGIDLPTVVVGTSLLILVLAALSTFVRALTAHHARNYRARLYRRTVQLRRSSAKAITGNLGSALSYLLLGVYAGEKWPPEGQSQQNTAPNQRSR